jgi:hypothetical protein
MIGFYVSVKKKSADLLRDAIYFLYFIIVLARLNTASSSEKSTGMNVGIIMYPDVVVFERRESRRQVSVLPLGSVVIWHQQIHPLIDNENSSFSGSNLEWIHLSFPSTGFVLASSVQAASNTSISSWPMWRNIPELFSAGKGVLASKKLSLGWINQWPIGTGGMGTTLLPYHSMSPNCN